MWNQKEGHTCYGFVLFFSRPKKKSRIDDHFGAKAFEWKILLECRMEIENFQCPAFKCRSGSSVDLVASRYLAIFSAINSSSLINLIESTPSFIYPLRWPLINKFIWIYHNFLTVLQPIGSGQVMSYRVESELNKWENCKNVFVDVPIQ